MGIKQIKFLDKYLGGPLCSALSIFNKGKRKGFNSILIIQLWGIGETILTLPAIRAVRKRFPDSRISVLTTGRVREIFLLDRDIDNVISLKLNPISIAGFILKNKKRFDLVIDFEEYLNISAIISLFAGKYRIGFNHSRRSLLYNEKTEYNDRQYAARAFLDVVKLAGTADNPALLKLDIPKEDKREVEKLLSAEGITKKDFVVGIAPGAAESAKSRMWPSGRYAELADILAERHKAKIIFIGSKEEGSLIKEVISQMGHKKGAVDFAGKVNLRQLFYLIERCCLVISNDTGPMHIAMAQGVKVIGLFGPNLPLRWLPESRNSASIYKKQECSPCINVHLGEVPECRWHGNDYQKCMKAIEVGDVVKAVGQLKGR